MDEKKLDQVQNLEDQNLEDVNGGSRILAANAINGEGDDNRSFPFPFAANAVNDANEEGDDTRSFPFPFAANAVNGEGEELDGGIPHLPRVKPTRPR